MLAIEDGWPRGFKQVKETGGRSLLDEHKKKSLRVMKGKSIFVETITVCVEIRTCRNL
jgi:hypothetical protein